MTTDFVQDLYIHFKAGYPVLAVNSPEEVRCLNQIKRAACMIAHERKIKNSELPSEIAALLDSELQISIKDWAVDVNTYKLDAIKLIELFDLLSKDDERIEDATKVAKFLDSKGYPVVTWDSINGFDNNAGGNEALVDSFALLTDKKKFPTHCVVVFKDAHHYLNSPETPVYRRALRNLAETNILVGTEIRRLVLLLQPDWVPHKDIDHCVTFVDFQLPNVEQLDREISYVQISAGADKFPCSNELRHQLRQSLRGFTQIEAQNALFYCLAKHKKFETEMLKTVYRLKATAVSKDDVLQIVDSDLLPDFSHFGGFENYIEFVDEVDACSTEEAQKLGIKPPKGCTIVGIPGTGKSRIALATAKRLRKPLIKFDLGAVFGSLVGQSEATMRLTLKRITAQGPCVLLIDEADKAFGGVVSSADSGDSGVSRRVFGRLLSWMANENKEAFVIMTMNRTLGVPPEILRAGRLDATFYTTFPSDQDREEIIKIHLDLNGVNHNKLGLTKGNWSDLVKMTENFVGAELEQLVLKAIRTSFRKNKKIEPSMKDFEEARQVVSPMAVIDKAGIDEIDRWCKDRAIPVSKTKKVARTVNVNIRRSLGGDPSSN